MNIGALRRMASAGESGMQRPIARIEENGGGGLSGALASGIPGLPTTDPWTDSLLSVRLTSGAAPGVDIVTIELASSARPSSLAPGDALSVALGYEDEGATRVFSGTIDQIEHQLTGILRLSLVDGGAALARLRHRQSFERQSAGAIVRELAAAASVPTGTIEEGVELAFFALDDRRSAWSIIAELALRNGFLARVTPAGELDFSPTPTAPTRTFRYGQDVLALDVARRNAPLGSVVAQGEGAAGSEGQHAWGWLIKDPASVTSRAGSGEPGRFLVDPAIRSAAASRQAAAGYLAAANTAQLTGTLLVPGAPNVHVGSAVEIAAMPEDPLNGIFTITALRHEFDKQRGFRTRLTLAEPPRRHASAIPASWPGL